MTGIGEFGNRAGWGNGETGARGRVRPGSGAGQDEASWSGMMVKAKLGAR